MVISIKNICLLMDQSLRKIFDFHKQARAKAAGIASKLDLVLGDFLNSPEATGIENIDGFRSSDGTIKPDLDHQVSTVREATEEYPEYSELVIDVFAEGRITVLSQRRDRKSREIIEPHSRTLYFTPDEPNESVTGRVMSAIADSRENEIANRFTRYLHSASLDTGPAPSG